MLSCLPSAGTAGGKRQEKKTAADPYIILRLQHAHGFRDGTAHLAAPSSFSSWSVGPGLAEHVIAPIVVALEGDGLLFPLRFEHGFVFQQCPVRRAGDEQPPEVIGEADDDDPRADGQDPHGIPQEPDGKEDQHDPGDHHDAADIGHEGIEHQPGQGEKDHRFGDGQVHGEDIQNDRRDGGDIEIQQGEAPALLAGDADGGGPVVAEAHLAFPHGLLDLRKTAVGRIGKIIHGFLPPVIAGIPARLAFFPRPGPGLSHGPPSGSGPFGR